MSRHVARRTLLASAGAAVATALAGCGYQPGGGELAWTRDFGRYSPGYLGGGNVAWRSDGTALYRVRNRDGRTFTADGWVDVKDAHVTAFDSRGEAAWSGTTERQYTGTLAVASGRIILELEDGRVTALAADAAPDEEDEPHADGDATAWTATPDGDGSLSGLYANDDAVVCVHADGLNRYDAATGDERFGLALDALDVDAVKGVAVADERTWLADSKTLVVVDDGGAVLGRRSIPERPLWLAATAAGAVVPARGELWILDANGDRAATVDVDGTRSTPLVADRTRCYYDDGTALSAIDVDEGHVTWRREQYSFRDGPVVNGDGVYGRGSGPETRGCGLFAITPAGEHWWAAVTPEELNCSGSLHLLGDRLVVRDDNSLYGFRTEPGRRFTVM